MSEPIEPPRDAPEPELEDKPYESPSQVEQYHVGLLHSPILRERSEPRDGFEPIPLWLVALFGALLFWGGWYLAEYAGGWRSDILDPRPAARFAGTAAADEGPADPMEVGGKLYTALCVSCHQQGGQGVDGQYPPLVGSRWVLEEPQRLKRILLHGLQGEIEVRGATYNGNMPAFGDRFPDERIAAVLTYIRNSWGNEADPIAPESVAATRAATEGRTDAWTAAELEAIDARDWTPPPPEEEPEPADATDEAAGGGPGDGPGDGTGDGPGGDEAGNG